MSETDLYNELESARQGLEKYVKEVGKDFCLRYALETFKDKKVRESFVKHIGNNEDFRDLTCHGVGRDAIEIVFRFQCRAPKICIVAPAFAVQYDIMTRTVIQAIDPFFP
jgi:hypothetical protein